MSISQQNEINALRLRLEQLENRVMRLEQREMAPPKPAPLTLKKSASAN